MLYQLIQLLYTLPQTSIFAVERIESDGKCSVRLYVSTSTFRAIMTAIDEYKRLGIPEGELFFRLLENSPDELLLHYWNAFYKQAGYTIDNGRPPVSYTSTTRIQRFKGSLKVFVLLRSKGSLYVTCGVFESMPEAKTFIADYLSPNGTIMPVMANNSLTREFLSLPNQ